MTRRAIPAAAVGVVMALTAAGCSGGGGGTSMTTGAGQKLSAGVAAVHAAVASGDRAQAVDALATLDTTVNQLRRQRQVSADRAAAILTAAADVEAQLGVMPTTTTSTTTTTRPDDHPPKKDNGGKRGGGGD